MKEQNGRELEETGGNLLKPKVKLVKGTRFVSFLFIAASILISAGIMQAANVYYDLDSQTIMTTQKQSMAGDVTISSGNILFSTTGTINQTGTGQVTFAGNVNAINGLDVTTADFTVGGGFGSTGVTISDAGAISADSNIKTNGTLGVRETTGSTFYTYFQGGDQAADITYTLPTDDGEIDEVLKTNGSGVLDWVPASSGTVINVGSQEGVAVAFGNSTASGEWIGLGDGVAEAEYTGRVAFQGNVGGATDYVNILGANVGIGVTTPSAYLNIKAGTATAGTAPLKFTAGTNLTIPETGAVEFDGNHLYFTDDDATPDRYQIAELSTANDGLFCKYIGATGHIECNTSSSVLGHNVLTLGDVDGYGAANTTGMALNDQALYLRSASATGPGVVTTGTQTMVGDKTFSGNTTLASTASATFTIGNSTGAGTIASGGTSSWTNTAGNLTIGTATSGTLALSSAGALNLTSLGAMAFIFDEADGFSLKDDQGSPVTYFEIAADGTMTLRTSANGDEIVLNPEGAGAGIVRVSAEDSLLVGDVPINGLGEGILVGIVNIFGFDYPTQCGTSCDGSDYVAISRDMTTFPNFPSLITGKDREYRLVINYGADLSVDGGDVNVQIYNTSTSAVTDSFAIDQPTATLGDVEKSRVFISANLPNIPTNGNNWVVRVNVPVVGVDKVRIYSLDLAAYDVVD